MTTKTLEEVKELAKGYDLVPIQEEIFADLVTPIQLLRKIAAGKKNYYLLESVEGGEKWGRYSFLGYDPVMRVSCRENTVTIKQRQETKTVETDDCFRILRDILAEHKAPKIEGMPPFAGGFVGYFAYAMIAQAEKKLSVKRGEFEDYDLMMFDKVIAVNLKAPYRLSQKAAMHFRDKGIKGKIINTASLFTTFGGVEVSGYTCSKHGVMGMTRALSNEFAPYGICVNAIAPGYIATELTKAIWSDSKRRQPMDERIPAGRWGTPDDFEGPAVFLASRASDYITGIMIPIDGGYSAR